MGSLWHYSQCTFLLLSLDGRAFLSQSIKNTQSKVPSFMNPFKKTNKHLHPQPGSLQNHGIFGRTRKNPPSPAVFLGRITLGTLSGKGVSIYLEAKKKKRKMGCRAPYAAARASRFSRNGACPRYGQCMHDGNRRANLKNQDKGNDGTEKGKVEIESMRSLPGWLGALQGRLKKK